MGKVEIYDTTLRDGSQTEGISFSVEDKLRITEKLDELGLHYVEGGWPGASGGDPRFGAWGETVEVWVDGSTPGPGNGTPENPFSDIRSAVAGYDLALASDSPCLDIGADTGRCEAAGATTRLVHVAPGTYDLDDVLLCCRVTLEGAGADRIAKN